MSKVKVLNDGHGLPAMAYIDNGPSFRAKNLEDAETLMTALHHWKKKTSEEDET